MKQAMTISRYTFIDLFKSRITFNVVILGLILSLISYVSYSFTYGVPQKVAIDIGLGLLTLSSVAVALFLGANLLSSEIESRTIYIVLSRSVSRFEFLLGKIFGLIGILFLNILILSSFIFTIYIVLGGEIDSLMIWNIFMTMLEALLVMMLSVFFSLISNKIMTVLSTLTLYIIGHACNPISMQSILEISPGLDEIVRVINWIVPNFYKLNLKDLVLYQQNIETTYLVSTCLYAIGYIVFLVASSQWIFKRKNLD